MADVSVSTSASGNIPPKPDVTNVFDMDSSSTFQYLTVPRDVTTDTSHLSTDILDMETGARYHQFPLEVMEFLHFKQTLVLGSGATGDVVLVEDSRRIKKHEYAAKIFSFEGKCEKDVEEIMDTYRHECGILQSVKHENIAELFMAATGPSYGVLIFKFYSQGALYHHIGQISKIYIWKYFVHILSAVRYLHDKKIVHRDIKLDNILVKNNDVFLTDFGLSERLPDDSNNVFGFAGTDEFVAPEVLAAKEVFSCFDGIKADSFSVGVFLWCLLMESDPDLSISCWKSLNKEVEAGASFDSVLADCALILLIEDHRERMTVTEIFNGLSENGFVTEMYRKLKAVGD